MPCTTPQRTLYIYIFYTEMKVRIFRVITISQKCDFQFKTQEFFFRKEEIYIQVVQNVLKYFSFLLRELIIL